MPVRQREEVQEVLREWGEAALVWSIC
jgi:hypothetical protein